MLVYHLHAYRSVCALFAFAGELPLEQLLQIYNLQQRSAVAEDRREISVNEPVEELGLLPQRSEEEKGSEASSADESGDEENGLEFLISGKRIEEVFIITFRVSSGDND